MIGMSLHYLFSFPAALPLSSLCVHSCGSAVQVCGGILGTTILWACFSTHHLRTYELFDGTNVWQKLVMSILVSFLSTFVLVITNFAVVQPVGHKRGRGWARGRARGGAACSEEKRRRNSS